MMTSSRLVRGTKGRLFACLGVLTLFAGVIFLYHSTRVELDEIRNSLSKCHQEQDSLAAQVQVISEYKKNLEKSLNQEKVEHRQTKEQLQSQMNDEQQLRDKENLENVNKYKALQQQYNMLKSEHEDLNEVCNKARSEQAVCVESLSHLEAQLATLHQEKEIKDALVDNLKLKYMKLETENKLLFQKINVLQKSLGSSVDNLHNKEKVSQAAQSSSTKRGDAHQGAHEGNAGTGNEGFHEQPQNVLPQVRKSSTAAQEEILQPARPAQPGLLQPGASKMLGKHTTTPQINPDALLSRDKASRHSIPALPLPILLSPHQKSASVERQEFVNNGFQGVLPAPLGFGSDNQYAQQNAAPLQAPYRLQQLGHQDVPQNQGQIPPLAPMALQNNVLPAPPESAHEFQQHAPHLNPAVHQIMNPFRGDLNIMSHGIVGHQDSKLNHADQNKYKFSHDSDIFHLNGLKAHDHLNNLYKNSDLSNKHKILIGQDGNSHVLLAHGNQFDRAANLPPFHKNVNIVPLDGDVNQHQDVGAHGGNPFAELGHHNPQIAHGKHHAHLAGQQEAHQAAHYNYQGGDYDKEDPPANNEAEDEDLDQIDYNNEPNPGHPAHPVHPDHVAPKLVHRRFADEQNHQDGVMVNPR